MITLWVVVEAAAAAAAAVLLVLLLLLLLRLICVCAWVGRWSVSRLPKARARSGLYTSDFLRAGQFPRLGLARRPTGLSELPPPTGLSELPPPHPWLRASPPFA